MEKQVRNKHKQWIAVERYRLRCVSEWPDSNYKQATLAAILSALESLSNGF